MCVHLLIGSVHVPNRVWVSECGDVAVSSPAVAVHSFSSNGAAVAQQLGEALSPPISCFRHWANHRFSRLEDFQFIRELSRFVCVLALIKALSFDRVARIFIAQRYVFCSRCARTIDVKIGEATGNVYLQVSFVVKPPLI